MVAAAGMNPSPSIPRETPLLRRSLVGNVPPASIRRRRARPAPSRVPLAMRTMPQPRASIIVVVDDHVDCIAEIVRAYAAQTAARDSFEVLVFDPARVVDWSPIVDRTLAAAGRDLDLRFVPLAVHGRAAALNVGLRRARAPLVIFVGDDIVPSPTLVESHLAYHREHPATATVGIGSAVFPPHLHEPFRNWLDRSGSLFGTAFHGDATRVPRHFFYIANASVKRELLTQAGPFNEAFPYYAWDDYEMSLRLIDLGMQAGYVRGAEAMHEHRVTLEERCVAMRRAGESARTLEAVRPGSYGWRRILRRDPEAWQRAARRSALGARVTGSRALREKSWQATLHAAFAAGYREAPASLKAAA